MERDGEVDRKVKIEFCNLPQGMYFYENETVD